MKLHIVILAWWLWLVPKCLLQMPLLSDVRSPIPLGECAEFNHSVLGNHEQPDTSGLVPRALLDVAMRRNPSEIFYTNILPVVQIKNSVVTCQSLSRNTSKYSTSSVLVEYICTGIACEQSPSELQNLTYVHLFSFVCDSGTNQYTFWDYVLGYQLHVDRITTNAILNTTISAEGSCTLCSNDPTLTKDPLFSEVSGCLSCKFACISAGLGYCSTSIGFEESFQTCCSYLYQPRGSTWHVCAQNCPAPFRASNSSGFCRLEEFPKLTSLDPNFPAVKVIPGSVLTYKVPLGFKEVAFICHAAAWPPVTIKWSSLNHTTDRNISFQVNTGNSTFVSALLRFHDGFAIRDTAVYACRVQETLSGVSVSASITLIPSSAEVGAISRTSCSLDSTTAHFQIQAFDTDCETWTNTYRSRVENDLYDIFTGGIYTHCRNCVTNKTTLVTSPLECLKGIAIFKGTVATGLKNHTRSIFCALYRWQQDGPTIIVAENMMHVIRSCNFHLISLDDTKRCSLMRTIDVPFTSIVISIAGVTGLLLFVATIVLISRRRRKQKLKLREEQQSTSKQDEYSSICETVLRRTSLALIPDQELHIPEAYFEDVNFVHGYRSHVPSVDLSRHNGTSETNKRSKSVDFENKYGTSSRIGSRKGRSLSSLDHQNIRVIERGIVTASKDISSDQLQHQKDEVKCKPFCYSHNNTRSFPNLDQLQDSRKMFYLTRASVGASALHERTKSLQLVKEHKAVKIETSISENKCSKSLHRGREATVCHSEVNVDQNKYSRMSLLPIERDAQTSERSPSNVSIRIPEGIEGMDYLSQYRISTGISTGSVSQQNSNKYLQLNWSGASEQTLTASPPLHKSRDFRRGSEDTAEYFSGPELAHGTLDISDSSSRSYKSYGPNQLPGTGFVLEDSSVKDVI